MIKAFGKENIFKDVDDIRPGEKFPVVLERALNRSNVLLVIIGQKWLTIEDRSGSRRLDNPEDFLRIEVQTGLERSSKVRVIPVLVDDALMPAKEALPPELRELVSQQTVVVRNDPDFHRDMGRLIASLKPARTSSLMLLVIISFLIVLVGFMLVRSQGIFPNTLIASTTNVAVLASSTRTVISSVTPTDMFTSTAIPAKLPFTSTSTFLPTTTDIKLQTQTSLPTLTNTPQPSISVVSNTKLPLSTISSVEPVPSTPNSTPALSLTITSVPTVIANNQWTQRFQDFGDMTMALVPPGCFNMGSDNSRNNEGPVKKTCFGKPFWIGKTEVTNKQYGSTGKFHLTNQPRETVTWQEAQDFCVKRGARLPMDDEWEYAARGPDSLIYPWGNVFNSAALIYVSNSDRQPAEVGNRSQGASWVGAQDMSGNVWEWTQNRESDNIGGTKENGKVARGGSWNDDNDGVTALSSYPFNDSLSSVGFRCVRDSTSNP